MNLSLLYRGWLTSCNYACGYCPFAKRTETEARQLRDQNSLSRFTEWIQEQSGHDWKILFTPWGEALVRTWYREAVTELTHVPHIISVSVQTNLSCGLDWIESCRPDRLALWATFHPTEADLDMFVRKVLRLQHWGVRISVGMVGVTNQFDAMMRLRRALPRDVYLWINAQQPRPRPYTPEEVAFLSSIDPQFEITARRHPSFGMPCRTGEVAFTVDGAGDMRRCHFVDDSIGNIYESDWEQALRPRPCPKQFCNCYLGRAQLDAGRLESYFGEQLLERIPTLPARPID